MKRINEFRVLQGVLAVIVRSIPVIVVCSIIWQMNRTVIMQNKAIIDGVVRDAYLSGDTAYIMKALDLQKKHKILER